VCAGPASETLREIDAPASAVPLTVAELIFADVTVDGAVMVVPVGATVSLTAVADAAGLMLPAASWAVALNVTVPSLRPARLRLDTVQDPFDWAVVVEEPVAWPAPSEAATVTVLEASAVPEMVTLPAFARLT
jgi:hypothetical protein